MVMFPWLPLLIHQVVESHFSNCNTQVFASRFASGGILLPHSHGSVPVGGEEQRDFFLVKPYLFSYTPSP